MHNAGKNRTPLPLLSPPRRRAIMPAALTLVLLTGAAPAPQPAPAPPPGAAIEQARIELVRPGDAPRRELRYAPERGRTERVKIILDVSINQSMNGQPLGARTLPSTSIVMETTPTRILDNGDIEYDIAIREASVDDNAAIQVQNLLTPLVGVSGKGVMSDRGEVRSVLFDAPPDLAPGAREQLNTMQRTAAEFAMPLPEEPVGTGAEWTVRTSPTLNGLTVDQTMRVTLASVADDGTLNLEINQDITGDRQVIDPPPQPGMELEVTSLQGNGEFDVRITPSMLSPRSSSGTTTTTVEMQIKSPQIPGGAASMSQETESTTTISTEPLPQ